MSLTSHPRKTRRIGGHRLACEPLEDRRLLAVVTSNLDVGPGTLRAALAGADPTIEFNLPAGQETIAISSELLVDRPVSIDGANNLGSGVDITIDAQNGSRVFSIDDNLASYAEVAFSHLTITGGNANEGAGIQSFENLFLDDVTLTNNHATGSNSDGGGIGQGNETRFGGSLVITNSQITNNTAEDDASAIDFYNSVDLTIVDSEITGNHSIDGFDNDSGTVGAIRVIDTIAPGSPTDVLFERVMLNDNRATDFDNGTVGAGAAFSDAYENGLQVVIQNSTIADNTQVGTAGQGAGLQLTNLASFSLTDSSVVGNWTAGVGGGILSILNTINSEITITNSTISENRARFGGGMAVGQNGERDNITITDSHISENNADEGAGGIVGFADLTLTRSRVNNNMATEDLFTAGGILLGGNSALTLNESTVSGNTVSSDFGIGGLKLGSSSPLTLNESTVSGNVAGWVGGISSYAHVTLNQSTVSGNSAIFPSDSVGGMRLYETLTLNQSTVADNHGSLAGGITLLQAGSIMNSILAGNTGSYAPDLALNHPPSATVEHSLLGTNAGNALAEAPVGSPDANGNLVGGPTYGPIDPYLSPLQDNGGMTHTHALLPTSPAIDMGDPGFASPPDADQRGMPFARVHGGVIDAGAYERINGDFNNDTNYDCADVDALVAAIATGTNDTNYDLNSDLLVSHADLDTWLAVAGVHNLASKNAFLRGDANLDGTVDFIDLNRWSQNRFTPTAAWCAGDWDASGFVDFLDLNLWSAHRFQSAVFQVPEPTTAVSLDSAGDEMTVAPTRDDRWAASPAPLIALGVRFVFSDSSLVYEHSDRPSADLVDKILPTMPRTHELLYENPLAAHA